MNKQEIKSEHMRNEIIQATIKCILDDGLNSLKTQSIANKANCSRGAIMHHYASKESLIHATLEYVLKKEIREVDEFAKKLSSDQFEFDEIIDELWNHFEGDLFIISIEYVNLSRTNVSVNKVLKPLAENFNQSMEQFWDLVISKSDRLEIESKYALHATLCMMRGLSFQSIWRKEKNFSSNVLEFWKGALKDYKKK